MKGHIIFLVILLLSATIALGDKDVPVAPGGGSGGGGNRQMDIDKILNAVKEGKEHKPVVFDELRTILWKNPITPDKYVDPAVNMYYEGNTTINRTQPVKIMTIISNNNPLELRRMLDLDLEVLNPGAKEYEQLNIWPEKIQTNEYDEKTNTTYRIWRDLSSFSYLKTNGTVKVRVNYSDGVNSWSTAAYKNTEPPKYGELVFNVTNAPPEIRNATITVNGEDIANKTVRYTDPIIYEADIYDPDRDLINITLHVLDDKGNLKKEIPTQQVKGGSHITIKTTDWGIFDEGDAGHNFTYNYTFDDGIVSNQTRNLNGPNIRNTPKLKVMELNAIPESGNNYWWQRYDFNLKVSNQNPEPAEVAISLFTNTPSEPDKQVNKTTLEVTSIPKPVTFKEWPFSASDAGKEFTYYVVFSEDVQSHEGRRVDGKEQLILNPRVMREGLIPSLMAGLNIILLLFLCTVIGIFLERRYYR